ncbi:hypothetical protein K443DRAFT_686123 [Laccaria amethystina LaAM-08-1]|uniref:ABC transporter domain-containing protein n=1 Tax=Laccaria amethystina LaAM-08-1 TaxID=1095629 RepID=A0A0C9WHK7_9AGAR|nr:hypothetical protein K443DRAFT_686123 [Laccaria amethystina LaAM-08-1]
MKWMIKARVNSVMFISFGLVPPFWCPSSRSSFFLCKEVTNSVAFTLEDATLKWKEVVDVEKQKEQGKTKIGVLSPSASSDIPYPTSSNDDVETAATSYTDELCDITVRFPEGQLSVVTGPSASGKTALLMALLGEHQGKIVMSKDTSRINENGYLHAIPTLFNLRD